MKKSIIILTLILIATLTTTHTTTKPRKETQEKEKIAPPIKLTTNRPLGNTMKTRKPKHFNPPIEETTWINHPTPPYKNETDPREINLENWKPPKVDGINPQSITGNTPPTNGDWVINTTTVVEKRSNNSKRKHNSRGMRSTNPKKHNNIHEPNV